ncbi:MAG: hypothetical protein KZQ83_10985 [gamma proteobacterium symbiont of Taylorina sp.]|nr:hypothetical protein [gamma proteobacterium symbiont of Taylorina sp.]
MNKVILSVFFCLLTGIQISAVANDEFLSEQRIKYDTIAPEDIAAKRQDIETMAKETLERLYKEYPEAEEDIKNGFGYGVFEGQVVNLVLYVAGTGLGVVYDNKTQTPIFMNAIRAGTGPGVGYKSFHGVMVFDNETVFDQFTNIGLQLNASGDAVMKIAGKGTASGVAVSLVPGVSLYQLIDTGLVVQANWGATEFLKDPNLNVRITSK